MKKKILALILCFTMVFTMTGYVGLGDYTFAYAEDMGQELQEFSGQENIEQEVVEVEKTIYQQLIVADSIEGMYALVLDFMNNDPEGLKSLTAEEIVALKSHVNMLDPESIEVDTQDLLDTLSILPNGGEELKETPELLADKTWTGTIDAQTLNTTQTIELTAGTHWITGTIIVNGGAHVTFVAAGDATIRRGSEIVGPLFNIHDGATLTIKGADGKEITLRGDADKDNGNDHETEDQTMIRCDGDLNLEYVNLINNHTRVTRDYKQTATDATLDNFAGGAITLCDNNNNVTIKNCVFKDNKANFGGAIYLCRTGSGTLTITDTVFDNCDAETSGGAIFFDGKPSTGQTVPAGSGNFGTGYLNYNVNLQRVTIQNCDSLAGCGSAIYMHDRGSAHITMSDSTVQTCKSYKLSCGTIRCDGNSSYQLTVDNCLIQNNTSEDHGAGIYWNALGSKAALVVNNSIIQNNKAGAQGGGMFVEGSSIEVTNTQIRRNVASMGGGIGIKTFADTGFREGATGTSFNMELGEGVVIENNVAKTKGGGISYNIVSGVPVSGFEFNYTNNGAIIRNNVVNADGDIDGTPTGVGGGIAIIDAIDPSDKNFPNRTYSANTVINAGTISSNKATDGGAAHITVGNFEMTGGTIDGHTVSGNGAGIYLTGGSVEISGGEIKNSIATNGAGVYMSNGSFTMTDGKLLNNKATQNGGAVSVNAGDFLISGGTIDNNSAAKNGGAAYVTGGTFTMDGGTISNNTATENGGAAYVATTGATSNAYTMNGGTVKDNAAVTGGGIFVTGGGVTMTDGTIENNTAAKNGGAIAVNGGGVTMSDGIIQKNEATENGGALYVTGGNFTMTSGKLIENTAGNEITLGNGGAAYVTSVGNTGGNVVIGIKNCGGSGTEDNPTPNHTVTPTDKAHPIIEKNTATDSGGGIALIGKGNITMYCGDITENTATNRGRGLNVYMEKGQFDYYNGDVGKLLSPELVIVGGKLNNYRFDVNQVITLKYFHCNIIGDNGVDKFDKEHKEAYADKIAEATKGSSFNLPDGEKYWTAPDGYRFFGWTFYGPNATDAPEFVRNKTHYQEMGNPILANDNVEHNYDGTGDGTINMYALWAPEQSKITYAAVTVIGDKVNFILDDEKSTNDEIDKMNGVAGNPYNYSFEVDVNKNVINDFEKAGYTFKGWYIYQNEGQNANWGYEPVYVEGTTESNKKIETLDFSKDSKLTFVQSGASIDFGSTNFGDVTLIARFEPAFADLRIAKEGWDSKDVNQTFIFRITGTPDDGGTDIDMTVTIHGNGEVLIKDLPVGTYKVEEVTEWGWRYNTNDQSVKLDDPDAEKTLNFKNSRDNFLWLSGDSFCDNLWNGVSDSIKRIFS